MQLVNEINFKTHLLDTITIFMYTVPIDSDEM